MFYPGRLENPDMAVSRTCRPHFIRPGGLVTRRALASSAATFAISFAVAADAQVSAVVPPESVVVDEHSVDLSSGRYVLTEPAGRIGPDEAPLTFSYTWAAIGQTGQTNNNFGYLSRGGEGGLIEIQLIIGTSTVRFRRDIFVSQQYGRVGGAGGILDESPDGRSFGYTDTDGVSYIFGIPSAVGANKAGYCQAHSQTQPSVPCVLVLLSAIKPNGDRTDIDWSNSVASSSGGSVKYARINRVTTNRGYRATYYYNQNLLSFQTVQKWQEVNRVVFSNLAEPQSRVQTRSEPECDGGSEAYGG